MSKETVSVRVTLDTKVKEYFDKTRPELSLSKTLNRLALRYIADPTVIDEPKKQKSLFDGMKSEE